MSITLQKIFSFSLATFLFLLPWQTIWITEEKMLNGVKWEWGTVGWYGTEVLLWLCVLLFIPWYWKQVKFRIQNVEFRMTPNRVFVLSCLLFIVYCSLTPLWAPYPDVAFQQAFRILEATLLFFMLFIGPLPWQKAVGWLVAGAVGQSVLGIWQFLAQSTFASTFLGLSVHAASVPGTSIIGTDGERWLRAYGAFTHPNVLGGYLVIALFSTLLLCNRENEKRIQNVEFRIKNILLMTAILLQSTALFFTFSRSAWIGAAIILCIFSFKKFARPYIAFISVLVLVLSLVYLPLIRHRVTLDTPHESASVTERMSGYTEVVGIIKENFWLGVGIGNYTAAVHEKYPNRNGWDYVPVHTVPLLILAELGIVGALLLSAVVVGFLWYTRRVLFIVNCSLLIVPLVLVDHYFFSSYVGLLFCAVFIAVASKTTVHNFSTGVDVDN